MTQLHKKSQGISIYRRSNASSDLVNKSRGRKIMPSSHYIRMILCICKSCSKKLEWVQRPQVHRDAIGNIGYKFTSQNPKCKFIPSSPKSLNLPLSSHPKAKYPKTVILMFQQYNSGIDVCKHLQSSTENSFSASLLQLEIVPNTIKPRVEIISSLIST